MAMKRKTTIGPIMLPTFVSAGGVVCVVSFVSDCEVVKNPKHVPFTLTLSSGQLS